MAYDELADLSEQIDTKNARIAELEAEVERERACCDNRSKRLLDAEATIARVREAADVWETSVVMRMDDLAPEAHEKLAHVVRVLRAVLEPTPTTEAP